MGDKVFPKSIKPIVSKGYGQKRGSNIWRSGVQSGLPRQGRDTYYEAVPINVTLVLSAVGRQAFWMFITSIAAGANSFSMDHDTGMGIEPHNVLITSEINEQTSDGINWVVSFTATAERTSIQDADCMTENLPDLYGCYGDSLGQVFAARAILCTTMPFVGPL